MNISKIFKIALIVVIALGLNGCSEDDGIDTGSNEYYMTTTYDYTWPSDLSGYKIRMTDTIFVREDRLFQEYLADGYSHAFVYNFLTNSTHEIYGYETDNIKYTSTGYSTVSGEDTDGTTFIEITAYYTYTDNGVDLTGYDRCDLHPTSAEGGVYMCWGRYPGTNPLYDAKTGTYEIVVDPSTGHVE